VPVLDAKVRRRVVREGLKSYLDDNTQAWEMQADGSWKRPKRGRAKAFSAQQSLLKALAK
jgi:polyphosphate kinase